MKHLTHMGHFQPRFSLAVIMATLITVCCGTASATPAPGPDDYGYSVTDIPYNLRDILDSGTSILVGVDDGFVDVPIGFSFSFYGGTYTSVRICSNGYFSFDLNCPSAYSPTPLPTADTKNNLVAGYWADLKNAVDGIRYETLGSPPNREFVVGFYDVQHYPSGYPVTFEMILHESGEVELQYDLVQSDGGSYSIGIENASGTIGLQMGYGSGLTDPIYEDRGFLIGDLSPPITCNDSQYLCANGKTYKVTALCLNGPSTKPYTNWQGFIKVTPGAGAFARAGESITGKSCQIDLPIMPQTDGVDLTCSATVRKRWITYVGKFYVKIEQRGNSCPAAP